MTTKLKWRLKDQPTGENLAELVKSGVLTKDEAREILLTHAITRRISCLSFYFFAGFGESGGDVNDVISDLALDLGLELMEAEYEQGLLSQLQSDCGTTRSGKESVPRQSLPRRLPRERKTKKQRPRATAPGVHGLS